jgi:hypothetical protein
MHFTFGYARGFMFLPRSKKSGPLEVERLTSESVELD